MSAWARPGVKCVCIDGNWPEWEMAEGGVTRAPMADEVLTISEVRKDGYLRFVEIPVQQGAGIGLAWAVESFRPLITRTQQQDVALFRDLLVGLPVGGDA